MLVCLGFLHIKATSRRPRPRERDRDRRIRLRHAGRMAGNAAFYGGLTGCCDRLDRAQHHLPAATGEQNGSFKILQDSLSGITRIADCNCC